MKVYIVYLFMIILSSCKSTTTGVTKNNQRAEQWKIEAEARKKEELVLISTLDTLSPTKLSSRCNFHESNVTNKKSDLVFTKPLVYMTPRLAKTHKVKGYVKLEYDVNSHGKLININVYEHFPNSIFDKLAISTLKIAQMDTKPKKEKSIPNDIEAELHNMMNKGPKKVNIAPEDCLSIHLTYDESEKKS